MSIITKQNQNRRACAASACGTDVRDVHVDTCIHNGDAMFCMYM